MTSGEKPDVLLLDELLPLMDGAEVLAKLSGDNDAAAIAIIVISGQPISAGLHPRIQRWLTKPVSIEELVSEIQRPRVPTGA